MWVGRVWGGECGCGGGGGGGGGGRNIHRTGRGEREGPCLPGCDPRILAEIALRLHSTDSALAGMAQYLVGVRGIQIKSEPRSGLGQDSAWAGEGGGTR